MTDNFIINMLRDKAVDVLEEMLWHCLLEVFTTAKDVKRKSGARYIVIAKRWKARLNQYGTAAYCASVVPSSTGPASSAERPKTGIIGARIAAKRPSCPKTSKDQTQSGHGLRTACMASLDLPVYHL